MKLETLVIISYIGGLVAVNCSQSGMGGGAGVKLACTGCGVTVDFNSLAMCSGASHNAVVSVALRLATFISGIGFAGYHTLLKRYLGMHAVCDKQFIAVIHLAYPHVKDILDEVCEEAKA